jgi:hypothetical protein
MIQGHGRSAAVRTGVKEVQTRADRHRLEPRCGQRQRKAHLLERMRAMHAAGLSSPAMASQLNAESVATLSGRGRWRKGTVAHLRHEWHWLSFINPCR